MDGHVRDCGGLGLFGVRLDRENLFPLLKFVTLPSSRSIFGARDERRTGVLAARTVSVTKGLPRSARRFFTAPRFRMTYSTTSPSVGMKSLCPTSLPKTSH